jgi:tetratricopeptide (TPR) repeat protein
MNRARLPFIAWLLLLAFAGQAQSGISDFIQATLAYDGSDYTEAWEKIHKALDGELKDKRRAEAHRYRVLIANRLALRPEAMPAGVTEEALADSTTASFLWFQRNKDGAPTLVEEAALEEGYRLNLLAALNAAQNPNVAKDKVAASADRLAVWTPAHREEFLHHYAIGQAYMLSDHYAPAQEALTTAIKNYINTPPEQPDPLMGTAHYWVAYATRYHTPEYTDDYGLTTQEGLQQTVDLVKTGLASIAAESKRLQEGSYGDASDLLNRFKQTATDLERMRLDCYLSMKPVPNEALPAFEAAIAADPENSTLQLGYGGMLENTGALDQAKAAYLRATELDPKNSTAWFNLGALEFNQAASMLQEANNLDDLDAAMTKQDEAIAQMAKAKAPLERALELDPSNRSAIQALMQIASLSGDMEGMKRYKELLNR